MPKPLPTDPLTEATYLHERNFALEVAREQTKFIDQTVLTLAGGALGVSLTFLEKFTAPTGAVAPAYLLTAWSALTLSIVGVLVGMHVSQFAIDKHIANLDTNYSSTTPTVFVNPFAGATEVLNFLASTSLIIGIVCLCVFAYSNSPGLGNGRNLAMTVQTPTQTPGRIPDGGWVPTSPPVTRPSQPTPPPAAPPATERKL